MLKYKNRVGWTVYYITFEECLLLGRASICDECGTLCPDGVYYVPVLNRFMCPYCFHEWNDICKFSSVGIPFERRYIKYYESLLGDVRPQTRIL